MMAVDAIDGRLYLHSLYRGKRVEREEPVSRHQWRMIGLTRDGTAESVSRDQIIRRGLGQPCSADHEQDWQPYRLMPNLLYM